jgi:flagellar hook-length control protein FliK
MHPSLLNLFTAATSQPLAELPNARAARDRMKAPAEPFSLPPQAPDRAGPPEGSRGRSDEARRAAGERSADRAGEFSRREDAPRGGRERGDIERAGDPGSRRRLDPPRGPRQAGEDGPRRREDAPGKSKARDGGKDESGKSVDGEGASDMTGLAGEADLAAMTVSAEFDAAAVAPWTGANLAAPVEAAAQAATAQTQPSISLAADLAGESISQGQPSGDAAMDAPQPASGSTELENTQHPTVSAVQATVTEAPDVTAAASAAGAQAAAETADATPAGTGGLAPMPVADSPQPDTVTAGGDGLSPAALAGADQQSQEPGPNGGEDDSVEMHPAEGEVPAIPAEAPPTPAASPVAAAPAPAASSEPSVAQSQSSAGVTATTAMAISGDTANSHAALVRSTESITGPAPMVTPSDQSAPADVKHGSAPTDQTKHGERGEAASHKATGDAKPTRFDTAVAEAGAAAKPGMRSEQLSPAVEHASASTPSLSQNQAAGHAPSPSQPLTGNTPVRIVSDVPLSAVPVEIGLKTLAGVTHFEIRLDPVDLGRIDVRLDIDKDGEVKAHLTVDRVETLALLQRDAKTLERAFEQAGLKPSEGGVDMSLRDQQGQSHGRHEHAGHGERGETRLSHLDEAGRDEPPPRPGPHRSWRGAVGGVDVRV